MIANGRNGNAKIFTFYWCKTREKKTVANPFFKKGGQKGKLWGTKYRPPWILKTTWFRPLHVRHLGRGIFYFFKCHDKKSIRYSFTPSLDLGQYFNYKVMLKCICLDCGEKGGSRPEIGKKCRILREVGNSEKNDWYSCVLVFWKTF